MAAVSRDKGSRSFKGVGFAFSNEYPRDCFQSGNAIADNETILYLFCMYNLLWVYSWISAGTDIYFTEVYGTKGILKQRLQENKIYLSFL